LISTEAITIRRYTASDKDAVWSLHVAALEAVGARMHGPWDADFQNIEGVYLNHRGEFLVGLISGNIVAMGALRKVTEDTAEVKRMRVHPDHWRRGFGQAIYDQLEARAIGLGYRMLALDTTTKQISAQQLYKKNGFREAGRRMAGPFEVILFEKDLA
jgi:GNAT superfamily N-acetyltransferase